MRPICGAVMRRSALAGQVHLQSFAIRQVEVARRREEPVGRDRAAIAGDDPHRLDLRNVLDGCLQLLVQFAFTPARLDDGRRAQCAQDVPGDRLVGLEDLGGLLDTDPRGPIDPCPGIVHRVPVRGPGRHREEQRGKGRRHHHRPAQPAHEPRAPRVDVLRLGDPLVVRRLAGEESHQERAREKYGELKPALPGRHVRGNAGQRRPEAVADGGQRAGSDAREEGDRGDRGECGDEGLELRTEPRGRKPAQADRRPDAERDGEPLPRQALPVAGRATPSGERFLQRHKRRGNRSCEALMNQRCSS